MGYEAYKAEEFAAYDEYNPMGKILVDGSDFLLNFDHTEGELVAGSIYSDGNDRLFGDLSNPGCPR